MIKLTELLCIFWQENPCDSYLTHILNKTFSKHQKAALRSPAHVHQSVFMLLLNTRLHFATGHYPNYSHKTQKSYWKICKVYIK